MAKLTPVQNKTIEEFWSGLDELRKQLKFREWELLNPHQEHVMVGGRSGKVSDTTGNRAVLLAEDKNYQHLQSIIKAVETTLAKLDSEMKEFTDMRFLSKESNYYEWEDIAYELGMSKAKAFKLRNKLMDMTAVELGWL